MRQFRHRRPSPALVISLIALFVSLGGVSYGVVTGSIGSRQIKNNSILGKDIRNSTVRGKDVRNDTLTGADIVESKLGLVPGANFANVAANASNAQNLDGFHRFQVKLTAGQTQTVVSNGPVSVVAQCEANVNDPDGGTNPVDRVRLLAVTSVNGAAMDGDDDHHGPGSPIGSGLEPNFSPDDRELLKNTINPPGTTDVDNDIDDGWVMGPGGQWIGINGEQTALGLNYAGSKCIVAGAAVTAG